MKPQSAKAKGRKFQQWVVSKLRERFNWDTDEATSRSTGAGGEDILLSPKARRDFPFSVECKHTQRLSIYGAYNQARSNCGEYIPIVVYRSDRRDALCILKFEDFLKVVG